MKGKTREIHSLWNELNQIRDKNYITIAAESKYTLTVDETFSFGNGTRCNAGYVSMFSARILALGLKKKVG